VVKGRGHSAARVRDWGDGLAQDRSLVAGRWSLVAQMRQTLAREAAERGD
jgi:hypothetical protein